MSLFEIFTILILHWIADFILQDEQWAVNKSKQASALLKHTITYSLVWFIPIWMLLGDLSYALSFVLITFLAHTGTDYFTSKVVSARFTKGYYGSSIPNFGAFTMIGLDQILHYVQLFLTYYLLKY